MLHLCALYGKPALPRKACYTCRGYRVYCVMQDCDFTRRRFLRGLSFAVGCFTVPGSFAEELVRVTPGMTAGPLYPNKLPLDPDNALIIVNDSVTPALGQVTHLSGRILDPSGSPVKDALIEIWQVDNTATYLKERSSKRPGSFDPHFQGFGRFLTGSTGEYYFRTIKPVAYPGRTPHIHFKIKKASKELLTTQCYIKGEPGNERDGIWRSIRDPKARDSITVDFAPLKESRAGEVAAKFDVVLGYTPEA